MKTNKSVVTRIAKALRDRVVIKLECQEEDVGVRGNLIASGSDVIDKAEEDRVIEELEHNLWAWCCVKLTVSWGGLSATDYLGACSYPNEAAFRQDGYFSDMIDTATTQLAEEVVRLRTVVNAIFSEVY